MPLNDRQFGNELAHGVREHWDPGDRAHYEYHCLESDESCDADLWRHSHQQVTVTHQLGPEESDTLRGEGVTFNDRMDAGQPKLYGIRFPDKFEHTAFEDELLTHPRHFERPDPPS